MVALVAFPSARRGLGVAALRDAAARLDEEFRTVLSQGQR